MLFHVTWEFIDTSEDGIRRSLAVFSKWQPPAGAEFMERSRPSESTIDLR
jgi:hypothetical protein